MNNLKSLFLIGCLMIFCSLGIMLIFSYREASEISKCETQPGVELTIVDKHKQTKTIFTGKAYTKTNTYYLELEFEPNVTTQTVCTASEYNTLSIGDSVLCTLYYNKNNELIKIDLE